MLSGSVNEYRLQLGRFKAGMCDAAWCAPCYLSASAVAVSTWGAITSVRPFTFSDWLWFEVFVNCNLIQVRQIKAARLAFVRTVIIFTYLSSNC